MNDSFVFKRGKYAGITYGIVMKTNPFYIEWVKINAPYLLKEPKIKEPKPAPPIINPPEVNEKKGYVLTPNLNFFNEGKNEKQ